jgi:hypothetical protein
MNPRHHPSLVSGRISGRVRLITAVGAALAVAGCAGTGELTPQQREGVELRRYCEQHHEDVDRCVGFLGWL